MRIVIQRVLESNVRVNGEIIGSIGKGILVLFGVGKEDTDKDLEYIYEKIINTRLFEDEFGKMNLSIKEVKGDILLVSQFTLYGDIRKGRRPSFSNSASGDIGEIYYKKLKEKLISTESIGKVSAGKFGADMKVSLVNDGPVTILLDSSRSF